MKMGNEIEIKENSKVHFIGIGGVSMSGLAQILVRYGHDVKGSDRDESTTTKYLEGLGIKCLIGHKGENIDGSEDLVVYTAAIPLDNPEMLEAKKQGVSLMDRATLLGLIMKSYKMPISIAGTHGKTSTTSMLTQMFLHNELDPTVTVGGFMPAIGGNFKMGKSDYFLVETCEYCNSFLKFNPKIAIILNVEADHLDFFKDEDDVRASFKKFINNIPEDGFIVINNEIKDVDKLIDEACGKVIKYSLNGQNVKESDCKVNIYSKNVTYDEKGCPIFDIVYEEEEVGRVNLQTFGEHNISNSLAVFAVGKAINLNDVEIIKGISEYKGVDRRFQFKGEKNGVRVVDDYAHHPTEIKATLKGAKNLALDKIYTVFQPHTYSRTISLLDEFAEAFYDSDVTIIMDIYPAREKDTGIVHARDLVDLIDKNIKKHGKTAKNKVLYLRNAEEVEKYLNVECINNELLITMGAGNVNIVGENYLKG